MDSPVSLSVGSRLDDYEIERLLSSEGSFGLVYLAYDQRRERVEARRQMLEHRHARWRRPDGPLGQSGARATHPSPGPRVVVKEFFPAELAQRTSGRQTVVPRAGKSQLYGWSRARFQDEARFLLRHDHPNVVAVFDVLSANNTEYMVMELLDGGSLQSTIETGGRQSEAQVRRWLLPVLRGLQSTEASGVDHLDLSPQNVVFRQAGGEPVLIDFGAARMNAPAPTRGSRLIVNDGYSAPEKYQLTSKALTARADVYAIGAMVNFAMSGERPASPMERASSAAMAKGLSTAALAERDRRGSRKFLAVVDSCLDLDLRGRPADASAVERALAPWTTVKPAPPAPQGEPRIGRRPAAVDGEFELRRRVQLAFVGLLGLLVVLMLASTLLMQPIVR